ncbi:MAG: DUF2723 domain-containing protein [Bacteroidia bacterium]|nr:DUF2723 domain-containing protein [Bacteroidia bacterium]MDW8235186.1 DUF2723 domain-containing protein [Bacteroidia bacterium]
MPYPQQRRLFGAIVFLTALITYGLTVAPTASFWDCGEFIATANELQVPHPPGAPLYLVVARFFAMWAPSPDKVAYFVNWVSVIAGAFTSLLIAWITMHFTRKLVPNSDSLRIGFSGLVGGLTATFADSVWFNTVEAEVYAPSAFFTALVIWLMCQWETSESPRRRNQYLILIAFAFGLSIGVHLLNLLTLPGLALMYYFRTAEKPTLKGAILAFIIGGLILGFLQYGVIQYTVSLAWPLEKILVGTIDPETKATTGLGLPFGSGLALFIALLFVLLGTIVWYAERRNHPILSTAALSLLFVYIGYTSYAVIFLRSQVNPPIDENDPGTVTNFLSYLKREQYGEVPILWGPLYSAMPIATEEKGDIYLRYPNSSRYTYEGPRLGYVYAAKDYRLFPRMWSPTHYTDQGAFSYIYFVKNKGADAKSPFDDKPTGFDNLRFFLSYQLYHMYIRYFLMNFVGRESETQDSRWESGLEIGRLRRLPTHRKKDPSKAHYYGLPLLLGLLGLFWQYQRSRSDFSIVAALFFFTGVAIIIYLNQPPNQPRERDYSYVGSFIVFAIWVGMGTASLAEFLEKYLAQKADYLAGVLSLGIPILMAAQNWRSHSRAGNYVPPDSAYNFLMSCPPNAILFTNGDNDTFPLWYLQEVEGIRNDVRIINLSLLNTDWYITQLKYQKSNEAPPVPISLPDEFFMGEKTASYPFPPQEVAVPVDKAAFLKNYPEAFRYTANQLADTLKWNVPTRGSKDQTFLLKQDYMTLDIIFTNARQGWKHPICFANTLPTISYMGLQDYLYMRGQVYELLPLIPKGKVGSIFEVTIQDTLTHRLLTQVYRYRNLDNDKIFYDSNTLRMIANYRSVFYRLAEQYLRQANALSDTSQKEHLRAKAQEIMRFLRKKISWESCPPEPYQIAQEANIWQESGDTAEARRLYLHTLQMLEEEVAYARYERVKLDNLMAYAIEATTRGLLLTRDTTLQQRVFRLYEEARPLLDDRDMEP